jgi:hypothetical protein
MTSEFAKLRMAVFEDPVLQRRLFAEADKPALIDLLVTIAQERGFSVDVRDVQAELREARRSWQERHIR